MTVHEPLVIGAGNPFRRDDGTGPFVAALLAARGFEAREESGEGARLIAAFEGRAAVVVVDAMRSGAPPGAVRRFDAAAEPLPAGLFHYSSHQFGVAEAVETARALGRLPPRLVVFGIEGADFGPGEGLSPAVEAASRAVAEAIAGAWPPPDEAALRA